MRNFGAKRLWEHGSRSDGGLEDANEQVLAMDASESRADTVIGEKEKQPLSVVTKRNGETSVVSADKPEQRAKKRVSEHHKSQRRTRVASALYGTVIAVCVLASVCVLWYAMTVPVEPYPSDAETEDEAGGGLPVSEDLTLSADELYASVSDSAVTIRATNASGVSCLSGVVVFSDGYVATLFGGVEGADRIVVTLRDGREYEAVMVGGNETADIVLLKIQEDGLLPINVSDDDVGIGDRIYAVGALSESLPSSLCVGEVAYCRRTVRISDGDRDKTVTAIQLDSLSGDALLGCPVFNEYGEAVGLMLRCDASSSFALPIDAVMDALRAIRDGEEIPDDTLARLAYVCSRLGVTCQSVDGQGETGARIESFVSEDSDVARKLREGDVIVRIGEREVTDVDSAKQALYLYASGQNAEIFVNRNGQILSFFVTLE